MPILEPSGLRVSPPDHPWLLLIAFDVSTLTTARQWITFNFSSPYTTVNGTHYVISIEYSGGNSSNYVKAGFDNSSPTHPGNAVRIYPWCLETPSSSDSIFQVLGAPSSPPVASFTANPTSGPAPLLVQFTDTPRAPSPAAPGASVTAGRVPPKIPAIPITPRALIP